MKKIIFLILFSFFHINLFSQKDISYLSHLWFQYFETINVNKKWALNADVGNRIVENNGKINYTSQFFVRAGLGYNGIRNFNILAGYALFFTSNAQDIPIQENRIWQRIQYNFNIKKLKFTNRFRFEQRWRQSIGNIENENYLFNTRIGNQIGVQVPFRNITINKKELSLVLSDEIFLNLGGIAKDYLFDQNRIHIGLVCNINPNLSVGIGFLHIYSRRILTNDYIISNGFRIVLNHNINLSP